MVFYPYCLPSTVLVHHVYYEPHSHRFRVRRLVNAVSSPISLLSCNNLLTASGPLIRISYNEVSVKHPDAPGLLNNNRGKGDNYKHFTIPKRNYINAMAEFDPKIASHTR